MENIALWHERDISHSSVERVLAPDTLILSDFSLSRMKNIIKNLVIDKKMMELNLKKTNGLYNSQRIMLNLIQKNITREKAYRIVQKIALRSWKENKNFKSLLGKNKEVMRLLGPKELNKLFDLSYFLKNIDVIYKRVLG